MPSDDHTSRFETSEPSDVLPTAALPSFVGTRVGPYLITKRLGAGGVGEVFKGIDVMLKREVALKVLHTDLAADPIFLERFRQEAQLQAKLSHLNIASVHAFVHEGDKQFIVMEYVAGISLDEFVRSGGPVPVERALNIFRQTLDGIEHAHSCGIIHRDIKPANIMLADSGQVKVMDFGIARALDSQEHLTRHGQVPGTAKAMSPEQIRGRQADVRSDIYSLGIVLYTLLAGHAPFDGQSDFVLMKCQLEKQPPALGAQVANLPPGVEAAVMRALEKDPSARFQNVVAFLRAIDECIAELGATSSSMPQPRSVPMPERTVLNPALHQEQTSTRTALNPAIAQTDMASETAFNHDFQLDRTSAQTVINPDVDFLRAAAGPDAQPAAESITEPIAAKFDSPRPPSPLSRRSPHFGRRVGAAGVVLIALAAGITAMWPRISAWKVHGADLPKAVVEPAVLVRKNLSHAPAVPAAPAAQAIAPAKSIASDAAPVVAADSLREPVPVVVAEAAPPSAAVDPVVARSLSIQRLPTSSGSAVPNAAAIGGSESSKFKAGERVKLLITSNQDAHVYCYLQDEAQRIMRFYPNRFNESALIKTDAPLQIPGSMRFEIIANARKATETVTCFASSRDVIGELPKSVVGTDFAKLSITSIEQIRSAFARLDTRLTEASFRVLTK